MIEARARVFYGWWVVLASALAFFFGTIPVVVFSFGVFLKPLAQEFHSGRAAISLAFTLHNVLGALAAPVAGRLVDRFGARRVILPATFIVSAILLSSKLWLGGIWQLYIFYAALGIVGSGAGPVPYCAVISRWFDRQRGLALSSMMFGLGCGALVMPSVAERLIAGFGWRFAFAAAGAAMLLISLPVVARFLKERPESLGLCVDGAVPAAGAAPAESGSLQHGLNWHEAWRTRAFWFLLCAFVLVAASVHACFTQLPAVLSDRGSTAQVAALASSFFGGGLLFGRAGSGYFLDRFFAPRVAALIFGGAAAGIVLLQRAGPQATAFTAAFLVGLGLGAEVDIMAYLISRYFGTRAFGEIYGFMFAAFALAGGLGAYLMGAAFDARGSYALPLALFAGAAFLGTGLIMCIGPYRYAAGVRLQVELGPAGNSTARMVVSE